MQEEIYSIFQTTENRQLLRLIICGITYPDKHYHVRRDNSTVCCIEYIEQGTGTVHLDSTTFHPAEGDSYMLQIGHKQDYFSDTDNPFKKYFINVQGERIEKLIGAHGLTNHYHFPGLNTKQELCEIIELAKDTNCDNTVKIVGLLNEIFFKMHASVQKESDSPDIAVQMKDFLNTKLHAPFKIEELCRAFSRSESQIIRIFKTAFGITPYAYVLSGKISLAKQMLRDSNLPVKEIAKQVCFADEYYFSNVFKNKTGLSPTAYRKAKRLV
ncbi:MAG: helix-turn-helix transcriptional regulator [Clostridia bacterium]|nr:helix-turn-helix transcriptional regulator [Clostridia bacterium]